MSPNSVAVHAVQGRSLWMDARGRFMRNRSALVSAFILAAIAIACVFGPMVAPHAFDTLYWSRVSVPPDFANGHYFGTDGNGRDLFVRVLIGGRISLLVGIVATLVSLLIGVAWGAAAGYLGGWIDEAMMRVVDVLYGVPFIFFVILMFVFFERSFVMIFVAIGAVEWLDMARVVRGQAISLKRREFVEAAHAIGLPAHRILIRHIIPNLLGPVVVFVTLTVPKVILLESFLSFLGLGVREPMTSWGVLINEGARSMTVAPWALVFPALFLSVTLFCFNYLGDGLRDALDPKDR
jgi:oligopeptide transport system permease protein